MSRCRGPRFEKSVDGGARSRARRFRRAMEVVADPRPELASCSDAFSSREPVPTPHQVRGRLSLENALREISRVLLEQAPGLGAVAITPFRVEAGLPQAFAELILVDVVELHALGLE